MSAYAALVSLQQILVTILCPRRIILNTAQLQILLEETGLLLNFLDISSAHKANQISALETQMRDAAHKAEDLIEKGILDSASRISSNSTKISAFYVLYAIILLSERLWIPSFLAEVVLCTMNAVVLYLYMGEIYVFPALNDSQELRRVLHDFKMIVKDVKEASGEPGMSAHAALISLRQILDSILDSGERRISRNRAHLECLDEKVSFLLGNASTYMSTLQNLDATNKDAADEAKKALIQFQHRVKFGLDIDSLMNVSLFDYLVLFPHAVTIMILRFVCYLQTSPQEMKVKPVLGNLCITIVSSIASIVVVLVILAAQEAPENHELRHAIDDFSIIVEDVIKIKDGNVNPSDLPAAAAAASSRQDLGGTGKDVVVGLDSELIEIKERLLQHSSERKLASFVGMGGIGKTTLARQVYNDPAIVTHFDVRAWVTVSQEYSLRHILLCLLDSAQMLTEEKHEDNEELGVYLHKYLTGDISS